MAALVYGPEGANRIKIIPVKALGDEAELTYLKAGFEGIQYAADLGADIILAAWVSGTLTREDREILRRVEEQGSLVVASAGNFPEEREQYPAAYDPVLAVTAVDATGRITESANYGHFVDIAAPGLKMIGPSPQGDSAYQTRGGTSVAAAIVAGAAAILKLENPDRTNQELVAALLNTAHPLEGRQTGDLLYAGKLGAGLLDLSAAMGYALEDQPEETESRRRSHRGALAYYHPADPPGPVTWFLEPEGEIKGFWIRPQHVAGEVGDSRLRLFPDASLAREPILDIPLQRMRESEYLAGQSGAVQLMPDPAHRDFHLLLEYRSDDIRQATRFCSGTVPLMEAGLIRDGSGDRPYAPGSDCKWMITAPEGKRIRIEFLELDTEPLTDWIYLFNGTGTHTDMMAGFSGTEIPEPFISWENQVLLWFVTNRSVQGQGWTAHVSFVDPP